ncbi:hypothetical protein [Roseobacter sp. CCS2]|uniref:hypothetical protein n=1 Tax=Roseobacter sp. CCS2 TaxID=391593 RepID=UPI0000F4016A|nr:hypothetical protein [Roseobacter sp. CCS2]EBA12894.1 hypothetical protein RCCS2_03394 [Roseobacter sp. CCS2]
MDKFVVSVLAPVLKVFMVIGVLCGIAIAGLGAGSAMEAINLSNEFGGVEPSVIISVGLGLILFFAVQYFVLKMFVGKAKARLAAQ